MLTTVADSSAALPSAGAGNSLHWLYRRPLQLWHTLLMVFVFGGVQSTQAQTAALFIGFRPVLAATSFSQGVNLIWTLIIVIAFIIGGIVALNGWLEKQRGEDGNKKLIAGIGAPLSLLAAKGIFNAMFPNVGVGNVQDQAMTTFDSGGQ
jgi:magnesium-transporting ATPase (P-type)